MKANIGYNLKLYYEGIWEHLCKMLVHLIMAIEYADSY